MLLIDIMLSDQNFLGEVLESGQVVNGEDETVGYIDLGKATLRDASESFLASVTGVRIIPNNTLIFNILFEQSCRLFSDPDLFVKFLRTKILIIIIRMAKLKTEWNSMLVNSDLSHTKNSSCLLFTSFYSIKNTLRTISSHLLSLNKNIYYITILVYFMVQ